MHVQIVPTNISRLDLLKTTRRGDMGDSVEQVSMEWWDER